MKVILPGGMARLTVVLLGLLIAVVAIYSMLSRTGASAHTDVVGPARMGQNTARTVAIALASPGRIEALSDLVNVGAAIDGVVRTIHVQEGQTVKRGDVLADLACEDLQSALQVAMANRDSSREAR